MSLLRKRTCECGTFNGLIVVQAGEKQYMVYLVQDYGRTEMFQCSFPRKQGKQRVLSSVGVGGYNA